MVPNNNDITLQHDGIYPFTFVNKLLVFRGSTLNEGDELCMYNTTSSESVSLIKDLNAGIGSSSPLNITAAGHKIFFTATNAAGNDQLWISNGTASGTKALKTAVAGSKFSNLSYGNGLLIFSYRTGATGDELWKTDGTAAGTVMIKDIYAGVPSSYPSFTYLNGSVSLLSAIDTRGKELWRTNGTSAGTVLIKNINNTTTASSDPYVDDAAYLNGKLVLCCA